MRRPLRAAIGAMVGVLSLPAVVVFGQALLAPGQWTEKDRQSITVRVLDSTGFRSAIQKLQSRVVVEACGSTVFILTNIDSSSFTGLRRLPTVTHIDRRDRVAREEAVPGGFDPTVNRLTAMQALYPTVNGENFVLSVKEKPFDRNDIDFKGRIINSTHFDEAATLHATFMTAIAAGGGNSSATSLGAGWGAGVTTSDFARLLPDLANELNALGVTVQNHSYGVGVENFYGIEAAEYDAQVYANPDWLHVFSSGNEGVATPGTGTYAGIPGFANLTGQFKVSKNTMAVGSSDRFGQVIASSSHGPAHDGRVKPELIAFGESGSSESAAVVSGIALAVQQAVTDKSGGASASLVKAILINGAQDTGRPHVDFESGFGNANARNSLDIVDKSHFFTTSVSDGASVTSGVIVPVGVQELKVTLAWTDPSAATFANTALVNDLDLLVRHVPSGNTWSPWVLNPAPSAVALVEVAQRNTDHLNNVEQVTIDLPSSGAYEIVVSGYDVPQGPQEYSVAYSFESEFSWDYPLQTDALQPDTINILRWHWPGTSTTGVLEYRYGSEPGWTLIDGSVDLGATYYSWATPDTSAVIQLRMTVGATPKESPLVTLSPARRLKVGFDCTDSVMLFWKPVMHATGYNVYGVIDKYLEILETAPDTILILNKPFSTTHFTVKAILSGIEAGRDVSIDYTLQAVGCYISGFFALEYIITDSAVFNLTLGTNFGVASLTLVRLDASGGFVPVQRLEPVNTTSIVLVDPDPPPGGQSYQVHLVTNSGQLLTSNVVNVLNVMDDDLYVYPNPASKYDYVNVIIADQGTALVQLLDIHGRVVRQTEIAGPEKSLAVDLLDEGMYILRVVRQDGKTWTSRVVVTK